MFYTIVSRDDCPWCDKAKELLIEKGMITKTVYVRDMPWVRTLVKMAGFTTVPQVFTPDGTHIGGYDDLVEHIEELH